LKRPVAAVETARGRTTACSNESESGMGKTTNVFADGVELEAAMLGVIGRQPDVVSTQFLLVSNTDLGGAF